MGREQIWKFNCEILKVFNFFLIIIYITHILYKNLIL